MVDRRWTAYSFAYGTSTLPRLVTSADHPLGVMWTVTSPHRSVRSTREPDSSSASIVDGTGWPNLLPVPTLMSAHSGRKTASEPADNAPLLPWWPTFTTSTSPTNPDATNGSITSASASPVARQAKRSVFTAITTLEEFCAGSSTSRAGASTLRANPPVRHASPATTSVTGAPSARASGGSRLAAPCATTIRPTRTEPLRAATPPV